MPFNYDFSPQIASIFNRRRFSSNFGMPQIEQPNMGPADSIYDFDPTKMNRINRFSTPVEMQTPAMDAYRKYLEQFPERENPSFWRKLAAGLIGAGTAVSQGPAVGIQATQEILERPYNRKLEDWANKGVGLESAARIESLNLGRENSAQRNTITQEYNQGRIEVAKMNAETARKKLSQGNFDYVGMTENGNPIIINKTDGLHKVLTDVDMFSDQEKVNKQLDSAMRRVEAQQTGALQRTRETNWTSRQNTKDRIEGQKNLQDDKQQFELENPDIETTRPNTSWEKYQDSQVNKQLAADHPDWVGKILFVNPSNGTVYSIPPEQSEGFLWAGGNKDKLDAYKLYEEEFNSLRKPIQSGNKPARSFGPKMITITSPDGKSSRQIPESEWPLWQSRGAKRK